MLFVIGKCKPDTPVLDLSIAGDALIMEETEKIYRKKRGLKKGIAFPTSLSVNHCACNYNPSPDSDKVSTISLWYRYTHLTDCYTGWLYCRESYNTYSRYRSWQSNWDLVVIYEIYNFEIFSFGILFLRIPWWKSSLNKPVQIGITHQRKNTFMREHNVRYNCYRQLNCGV